MVLIQIFSFSGFYASQRRRKGKGRHCFAFIGKFGVTVQMRHERVSHVISAKRGSTAWGSRGLLQPRAPFLDDRPPESDHRGTSLISASEFTRMQTADLSTKPGEPQFRTEEAGFNGSESKQAPLQP